jgi:single-strand DNA-binding protein
LTDATRTCRRRNEVISSVTLAGRLGSDPERVQFQDGKTLTKFSVAVYQGVKDKPAWIPVVARGKSEDSAGRLRKGHRVIIQGQLQENQWTDKTTGNKRSQIFVHPFQILSLEPRDGSGPPPSDDDLNDVAF